MPNQMDLAAVDSAARIASLTEWELVQVTHDCEVLRAIFNRDLDPFNRATARNLLLQLQHTLRALAWTPTGEDVAESPIVLEVERPRHVLHKTPLRFPTRT